ncbi:heat shock 70 kDa protein 12A-like [Mercenaria mercenaria]|uniref:heat shock 70 kDa protein 12A-like n=1 Tax=Mercenaria mercenaria TaxID=6596 RepID=UPI00234E3A53|nr:heat shock 70 kDa protein 12A-like [Mercenaria mercenaria]XP_053400262.1 heat shock 70 kDa protein 12A-like [Mercenaria mercenaria]
MFKSTKKLDALELAATLEMKKRQCKAKSSDEITISLPNSLYTLYHKIKGKDLQSDLGIGQFVKTVRMRNDKLRVGNDKFKELFENAKLLLLEHLKELCDKPELKNVSTLMMVGGFSESPIMHKAVMEAFPNKHVIIPQEAGTIVMRGAVIYGFKKEIIHSRKIPFSYGISSAVPFDPRKHPANMKCLNGFGFERVEDVFHEFVRKGQTVIQGETKIQHSFMTSYDGTASVEVYQTPADKLADTSYTSGPEFERIGELSLIPKKEGRQQIDVTMTFGGIELEVEAKDTGRKIK